MINSMYEKVFGPTQPPIPDPSHTNSPTSTTSAAQNALNGTSNSTSSPPVTETHKVSWIGGAWETLKGGASLVYNILTHPLVKIVLSVIIIAACTIGFFALVNVGLTLAPTMFAAYAFGLIFGISVGILIAARTILGGGAPPPGQDNEDSDAVDSTTPSSKPNEPVKPVEETKPLTYVDAMARLREKEKEIEELKKANKVQPDEDSSDDDFIPI